MLHRIPSYDPGREGSSAQAASAHNATTHGRREDLKLRLPARPANLAFVRRRLRRWLNSVGATGEELSEIALACHESCANAVKHGSGPPGGLLLVHAAAIEGGVEITVRDFGRWRPPGPSAGGRGIELIRSLMDSAEVLPGDDGTTVRMRRALVHAEGRR